VTTLESSPAERLDTTPSWLERPVLELTELPHFGKFAQASVLKGDIVTHYDNSYKFRRAVNLLDMMHNVTVKSELSDESKQAQLHAQIDRFRGEVLEGAEPTEIAEHESYAVAYLDVRYPIESDGQQASWARVFEQEAELAASQQEMTRQRVELDRERYEAYLAASQPGRLGALLARVAFWRGRTDEEASHAIV
jgi:hypothetical protein